jgi:hypothetical protein
VNFRPPPRGQPAAMGFFFKALAAIVTADAIDRHARSRPTR